MAGDVNFYLKKPERKGGLRLVYLKYKYNGQVLVWTFGQRIYEKDWNRNKQRVKSNIQTTTDGQYSLNDLLDNLAKTCKAAYNSELKNGIPPTSLLKRHLNEFINQNTGNESQTSFHKLLERFIAGEIKHKGKEKSPNTIKTYQTFKGHLAKYELEKKTKLDYHNLDLNFLYKYITFLRSAVKLGQNAIAKDVQILKTVMKKAVTFRESNNLWHEHEEFIVTREESDAVFLTESEIMKLYKCNLSHSKRLELARDLFVFGCFVGLRFSDYSDVKPENIVNVDGELFIKIVTKKTNELVIIPCNSVVLQIFNKYKENDNRLPKATSNQKFNVAIKEACFRANFLEKGRLINQPDFQLYECISSHTARRSFATNLYLEGFPVIDLMKITGHRTEKAFMRYIKHTKLDAAKRLNTHIKTMWSKKLLRVAGDD